MWAPSLLPSSHPPHPLVSSILSSFLFQPHSMLLGLPGCITAGLSMPPLQSRDPRGAGRDSMPGLAMQGHRPQGCDSSRGGGWGTTGRVSVGLSCAGSVVAVGPGSGQGGGVRALTLHLHTLPLARQPQECGWQRSRPSCGEWQPRRSPGPPGTSRTQTPGSLPAPPGLAPSGAGKGHVPRGEASHPSAPSGRWEKPPVSVPSTAPSRAGAIPAEPQLPASTFAKAGPWHCAPKPHPPLLAGCCVVPPCTPVGAAGVCPHTLCGGSQCNGVLSPPIEIDTAGCGSAAGATQHLRVPRL